MGKLFKYLIILVTIDLIWMMTIGVDSDFTLNSPIANFTFRPTIQRGDSLDELPPESGRNFSGIILGYLLVITISGAVGVGLAYITKSETFIWLGFASGILYNIVIDFGAIYLKLYNIHPPFSGWLAGIILIPLMAGVLISIVDWLRGKD